MNSLHTTEVTASRTEYPSVQIVCRTYSGALEELKHHLLESYELYWPNADLWPGSSLSVVWDEESEKDHLAAAEMPPWR